MQCSTCGKDMGKHGKDRYGNQRFRCRRCGKTESQIPPRAFGDMRLPIDKGVQCLRMLLEGNSIRSVERLTGVHRDTIMSLVVTVGNNCKDLLREMCYKVPCQDVQVDEVWGFVGCKEKTRQRLAKSERFGDAYCFTAIERHTKLLLAWHLGKRTSMDTFIFCEELERAVGGHFQVTTDGYTPYQSAIPDWLRGRADYATLIKTYGETEGEKRYSPGTLAGSYWSSVMGIPDESRVCTSHVERSNLTWRMAIRRMTRLTNAFSKKWENHESALALCFAYYNFCRVHSTLKTTPAVQAGIADHVWSVNELVMMAATA